MSQIRWNEGGLLGQKKTKSGAGSRTEKVRKLGNYIYTLEISAEKVSRCRKKKNLVRNDGAQGRDILREQGGSPGRGEGRERKKKTGFVKT